MTTTIAVTDDTSDVRTRLEDFVSSGARGLVITDPVDLTLPDRTSVDTVRLLRDAVGHGLRIDWRASPVDGLSVTDFTHLPPPANLDELSFLPDSDAESWLDLYSYGQLFYRVGPGFVSIKDVRPTVPAARMTLEEEEARIFLELAEGGGETGNSESLRSELVEYGLGIAAEGGFLVLPYRIRQWPIPFSAI
ncbi:hypothetical protein SAMN04487905_11849 [Actinopolyspora xinjiangensis]|uniref:Uncharacterized protein n=1 Tax=Actinopolyspora xinjiangensis TaxID=405564 RepID=A0A1H0WYL0_9ACTN|nr:DUF5825 family protein [Actinopolyspora xinjiangensis]SDP95793.1 hypothetical protein SAMN04487905_11849 [Actinopolyspora xinjiangensis]